MNLFNSILILMFTFSSIKYSLQANIGNNTIHHSNSTNHHNNGTTTHSNNTSHHNNNTSHGGAPKINTTSSTVNGTTKVLTNASTNTQPISSTSPPSPRKPSLKVVQHSCHIKGGDVYFDAKFYLNNGKLSDVYMCYKDETSKRCTEFPICEKGFNGLEEWLTCKGMLEWNPNPFQIFLVNGEKDNITLYKKFIPAIDRKSCNLSSAEVIEVGKISDTETSITVQANITEDTYASITSATIEVTREKFKKEFECLQTSFRSTTCEATNLTKCTAYKLCVAVETKFFQTFTKCITETTKFAKPETPRKLYAINIGQFTKYFQETVIKWKGPKLNTTDDYYQYTYVKDKEVIEMITTTTKIAIEPDMGSIFTVQLCTLCGCSDNATIKIEDKNPWDDWVSSQKNQKNKDQEKYTKKLDVLTGLLGGTGGGLLVALFAAGVYFRNKNKRKRNSLLQNARKVTYSRFDPGSNDTITL